MSEDISSDIEVIENLEALAALTGDHEGILRAAIDRISALKQQLAHFSDLASKHRDELEQEITTLRRQVETARKALTEAERRAEILAIAMADLLDAVTTGCQVLPRIKKARAALDSIKTEG